MSLQHVQLECDGSDTVRRGHALSSAEGASKTYPQTVNRILNARVVEFIAKPGKFHALEDCVRGEILEFLNRQEGFSGAIILNSHQERRQILVVSFWTTQRIAAENCWERSGVVRKNAGSLIDVCSRARTYEAGLSNVIEFKQERVDSRGLWPEVRE